MKIFISTVLLNCILINSWKNNNVTSLLTIFAHIFNKPLLLCSDRFDRGPLFASKYQSNEQVMLERKYYFNIHVTPFCEMEIIS